MRILERASHLPDDSERVGHREGAVAPQAVAERAGVHVRHGEVQPVAHLARVVERQQVRVMQPRGRLDLLEEALVTHRAVGRREDLEGDAASVLEIGGQEHDGRCAASELALELVATGERLVDQLHFVRHRR